MFCVKLKIPNLSRHLKAILEFCLNKKLLKDAGVATTLAQKPLPLDSKCPRQYEPQMKCPRGTEIFP